MRVDELRVSYDVGGFDTKDDWMDYRIENDERFAARIDRARQSLREGRGVKLQDLRDISS